MVFRTARVTRQTCPTLGRYDPETGQLLTGTLADYLVPTANEIPTPTLDKTITEGIGDNEMCMLFGYAWPPTATCPCLSRRRVAGCT